MYAQLEHWDEVLRLQMEKIGLYDFQLQRKIISSIVLKTVY